MEIIIAAVVLVGLCVFGLCFNIIFRENGHFPETEIENNKEMRKRGIGCVQSQDREARKANPHAIPEVEKKEKEESKQ